MGRPINKKHIGDGAGKLQVTAVKFAAGGEITTESHIVSQRSTNKFIVTDGAKTETCTLVNKSIGGVVGMDDLNTETAYTVANKATNTFELTGVDSSGFDAYTSGGVATKAATGAGNIVVDAQAT